MIQEPPCVLATGDQQGLTAEFPFKGRTSLLQVTTDEAHPQLGHGVLVRLSLPSNFSTGEEANRLALDLNQRELRSLTRAHFFGSWCNGSAEAPTLTYVSFYPNVAYQSGLLPNVVISTMQRARWVAEEVFDDDWSKTFASKRPSVARLPSPQALLEVLKTKLRQPGSH